jgi:DNA mismatch endonuclease (patch repair protein)
MHPVTKHERSRIMAAVRSANTRSTEWKLRSQLITAGVRGWQCQVANLPGKPDFIFPRQKLAVFVDGCFWHACPKHCTYAKGLRRTTRPFDKLRVTTKRTGRAFWLGKLAGNIARDRRVNRQLRRQGWRVVRIWEHELAAGKRKSAFAKATARHGSVMVVERIRKALGQGRSGREGE